MLPVQPPPERHPGSHSRHRALFVQVEECLSEHCRAIFARELKRRRGT
jgi:hypothetical protein